MNSRSVLVDASGGSMLDVWCVILDLLDVLKRAGLAQELQEDLERIRNRIPIRAQTLSSTPYWTTFELSTRRVRELLCVHLFIGCALEI